MDVLKACRAALFHNDSVFRTCLKSFILWGHPSGGDMNATLKEFRTTQFGNDVFTGVYALIWMWVDSKGQHGQRNRACDQG